MGLHWSSPSWRLDKDRTRMVVRYNEHGGLIIRQSDLGSYTRCPQQKKLSDKVQAEGRREQTLSATVYGTVVHHALETLERLHHQGRADALEVALATFNHYWLPENIGDLEPGGIDVWLPRTTYGGFREKGRRVIEDYYDLLKTDDSVLLALEYQFSVPIWIDGRQHTLTGTLDRLSRRIKFRKPYLNVEDHKTGKVPTYLRYNMQFTAYCYASTRPEFWTGFDDPEAAYEATKDWPRRGTWIDLQKIKKMDAGFRTEQDYRRLQVALREYVKAVEHDVYPLNMKGDTCMFCPFARDNVVTGEPAECGGVALPELDEGAPS